ncbi:urease subunit beta [Halobacteria archaeon HArc-gm2]|nr:urease subunit beta [Halobacteria archaeon HArc-gm2]
MSGDLVPGAITARGDGVRINEGRETATLRVANTGDRPIQVGSHFHFFEANRALSFDRAAAFGMRLDVPAGTAVRFEPGDEKTVDLVAVGGAQIVTGMNDLTNGPIDESTKERALERAAAAGFEGA